MICRIAYPGDTAGTFGDSTTLLYDGSGRLLRIIDPGTEVTEFSYAASGELAGIQTPLVSDWLAAGSRTSTSANLVTIAYTNGKTASVTLPAADGVTTAGRLSTGFTYGTGTTAVSRTGISGTARTVTYDGGFRQLTDKSPSGLTSSQVWSPKDMVLSSADPSGRTSTTIYDSRDRPTDTYGPAPAACLRLRPAAVGLLPDRPCALVDRVRRRDAEASTCSTSPNAQLSGQPKAFSLGLDAATPGHWQRGGAGRRRPDPVRVGRGPAGPARAIRVRQRGWPLAAAIALILAAPLVAAVSYAIGPFDAQPWWEAVPGCSPDGGLVLQAAMPGHTLQYEFAATAGCGVNALAGRNGNRTKYTDTTATGAVRTTTYCYDQADRLTSTTVTNPRRARHPSPARTWIRRL